MKAGERCTLGYKGQPYDSRWKDAVFIIEAVTENVRGCQTGISVRVHTTDHRVSLHSLRMTLDSSWIQPLPQGEEGG